MLKHRFFWSFTGMKNREERSKHFFDTSVPLMDDGEDDTLYDRVS